LSVLMLAGIRDILLISKPGDLSHFGKLLGDGTQWASASVMPSRPKPDGNCDAPILIAESFLEGEPSCPDSGEQSFSTAAD